MCTIHDIPTECLVRILNEVTIASFYDGESKLGALNKCVFCTDKNIPCKHLREAEVVGIKFLKLVCKEWRDCISTHWSFIDGPAFVLLPNF